MRSATLHAHRPTQIRPVVDRYNASSLVLMDCWTYDQVADAVTYMNASARQLLNDTAWGLSGMPGSAGLDEPTLRGAWSAALTAGVRGFSMSSPFLTAQFVAAAHLRLLPVNVWTVDDAASVNAFIDMGVDGILTNDVAAVGAIVASRLQQALTPADSEAVTRGVLVSAAVGSGLGGLLIGALLLAVVRSSACCRCGKRSSVGAGTAFSRGAPVGMGAAYESLRGGSHLYTEVA